MFPVRRTFSLVASALLAFTSWRPAAGAASSPGNEPSAPIVPQRSSATVLVSDMKVGDLVFTCVGVRPFLEAADATNAWIVSEPTPEQRPQVAVSAERRLGTLYDTGFDLHSRRQFCSRYVREVLFEATGQSVLCSPALRTLFDGIAVATADR
jgi:hypothetical protein